MPGGMGFGIQVAGNAFRILQKAAKDANKRVMATVVKSAVRVQRGAKENVKTKLNTTGKSTGLAGLGGSIGIEKNPAKLEARIGPGKIYGRIHEFGGVIENGFGRGIKITIPKRAYLQPALDAAKPAIERDFQALVGDLLEE